MNFPGKYGLSATDLPGYGKLSATSSIAREATLNGKKPPSLAGLTASRKLMPALSPRQRGYCSGGFFSDPGLTDRMNVIIFHRSSEVLMIPPKGGIGPTTTSLFTRL